MFHVEHLRGTSPDSSDLPSIRRPTPAANHPNRPVTLTQMRAVFPLALCAAVLLSGCHSAYIEATVSNRTGAPIPLLEVDYPSASFGTQDLASGADFHYRFKILGSGATTLLWTDASHHDNKSSGPTFKEGDEGRLTITITPQGPQWQLSLRGH